MIDLTYHFKYFDSTGQPINVGDQVMHDGGLYAIKRFLDGQGREGIAAIEFIEGQPDGRTPDEWSVDLVKARQLQDQAVYFVKAVYKKLGGHSLYRGHGWTCAACEYTPGSSEGACPPVCLNCREQLYTYDLDEAQQIMQAIKTDTGFTFKILSREQFQEGLSQVTAVMWLGGAES
jgi:hypothetical protein